MDSRECDCMGEGCWRCKGMGTLPTTETTETVTFVRVALCATCGVRHPWTPERGWGCPRVVAPQDTTGALAVRLRDAQTVALALALRAVKTRRDHALQVETTARVTAERDAAVADLDIERDSRDINRSLDAAAAVRAMYRESDANEEFAAVTAERDALHARCDALQSELTATKAALANAEWRCEMACESPRDDCDCCGCSLAAARNARGEL